MKDAFIPGLPRISASTWSKMQPGTIWAKFRWISHSNCETVEIKTCYGEELSLLLWTPQTHQHTHRSFHIKRSFKVYKRWQTAYFHKSSLLACSSLVEGLSANCLFSLTVKLGVDVFVASSQRGNEKKGVKSRKKVNESGRREGKI